MAEIRRAVSPFHFHESAEHGHPHGTWIEGLDPRVKLGSALVVALWIGLLPAGSEGLLVVLAVVLVVAAALAQIPPGTLLVRSCGALPFVVVPGVLRVLTGTFDGPLLAAMAGRGYVAAMVATFVVTVTPFPALLGAASALGAPDLLVQTTALIYRYLAVLRERGAAMTASARARGYGHRTPGRVAIAGAMLGSLLLASLGRAERVHRAMLARGYTGRFPVPRPLRMRPVDWGVGVGLIAVAVGTGVWLR